MLRDRLMMRPLSKLLWRKELHLVRQREQILQHLCLERCSHLLRLRQERKRLRVTNLMET